MNLIHYLRLTCRFGAMLAALAAALVASGATPAFAGGSPAPGPAGTPGLPVSYPCTPECSPLLDKRLLLSHGHWTGPVYPVHTVVVGGMSGWQIALIATGAALLAAVLAVLADRMWAARRREMAGTA